jgi:predicted TIM-barrel fold metal-dependent hydrolase
MPEHSKLRFDIPPGACDCHVHVFDLDQFPYSPKRSYTPGRASIDDLLAFERQIGMSRYVLVQPSPYGADSACLLAALNRLGNEARGVAVIDPDRTPDSELDALAQAGVRSVRVNLEAHGNRDPRAAARALHAVSQRITRRGWSIQVYASLPVIAELSDNILRLPVLLVVDHFGGVRAEGGTDQPGFAVLIEMLKSGRVYLKLSAPYRISQRQPSYEDVAEIARAFIAAAPERIVWASDWPHTGGGVVGSNERKDRSASEIEPFRQVDVPNVLSLLAEWAGDRETWCRILVDNPACLYGLGVSSPG